MNTCYADIERRKRGNVRACKNKQFGGTRNAEPVLVLVAGNLYAPSIRGALSLQEHLGSASNQILKLRAPDYNHGCPVAKVAIKTLSRETRMFLMDAKICSSGYIDLKR